MHLQNYLNGTHLADLHGLNLKSDEVIDLLERFKMDVIYDFDRLHEGGQIDIRLQRSTEVLSFSSMNAMS
jgi:hypothetical protein